MELDAAGRLAFQPSANLVVLTEQTTDRLGGEVTEAVHHACPNGPSCGEVGIAEAGAVIGGEAA